MKLFRSILSLILLAVVLLPTASASAGSEITVNTAEDEITANGLCSLREAIHNANNNAATYPDCWPGSAADTISFEGDYTITLQRGVLPSITTGVTINGKGADKTIIQASTCNPVTLPGGCTPATHRVLVVIGGNLTLNGVSVRHGSSTNGGGLLINEGILTVANSIFSGNLAGEWGGAIFAHSGGEMTIINSSFLENKARYGAGILVENNPGVFSTMTVTNSSFEANSAEQSGGAIKLERVGLTMTNSSFEGNSAATGGGIYAAHSGLIIGNSRFEGNSGWSIGGGIGSFHSINLTVTNSHFTNNSGGDGGAISGGGRLAVKDSTFSGNSAENGGAIFVQGDSASLTATNSTFSGNSANGSGGAIGLKNTPLSVTNSTFTGNTAGSGGGISVANNDEILIVTNSTFSNNSAATEGGSLHVENAWLTLTNTIVADSPSGGNCAGNIVNGDFFNDGNNLDSGDTCGWGSNKKSMSNTDPKLGPLADNGGPTHTLALLDGSPAINAGNAAVCSGDPVNGVDQRGVTRPQGIRCDIGAYEKEIPLASSFGDVPLTYWAWDFIERLYGAGITGGCSTSPLNYCPEQTVTRAQMAVFLLRGINGATYNPPAVGNSTGFGDVATNFWAAAWIKQLAAEGITGGCSAGNYCPAAPVTRAAMAVFLLRSKHGSDYTPPAVGSGTGFTDVPSTYWAAAWIKQLVAEGITTGCGAGTYCPEAPVTRAQMAVFLVKTFNLP